MCITMTTNTTKYPNLQHIKVINVKPNQKSVYVQHLKKQKQKTFSSLSTGIDVQPKRFNIYVPPVLL